MQIRGVPYGNALVDGVMKPGQSPNLEARAAADFPDINILEVESIPVVLEFDLAEGEDRLGSVPIVLEGGVVDD